MKSILSLLILPLLVLCHPSVEPKSYKNYRIVEFTVDAEHHDLLHSVSDEFDFLALPNRFSSLASVMLAPHQVDLFVQRIAELQILNFTTTTADLGALIDREHEHQSHYSTLHQPPQVPLDHFARHAEINAYLDHLAATYPDTVLAGSAGRSHEQRDLRYVRIGAHSKRSAKRTILIDAGVHAREWIAPATALYVVHQLVERASEHADLLADTDFVVLPSVNPDGYEYAHDSDRMWRKTRQPNAAAARCPGADGNRNFGYEWGGAGASAAACTDTFRGSRAFSEPETRAVRDLMRRLGGGCKFYLTLHSYGNMLLYPWGWAHAVPENWRDLEEVAQAGAQAIARATGTQYWVASSSELYLAAGGSDDYALGGEGIPIALTMELPGKGGGFVVPAAEIAASVRESWEGIRAMALRVIEKY